MGGGVSSPRLAAARGPPAKSSSPPRERASNERGAACAFRPVFGGFSPACDTDKRPSTGARRVLILLRPKLAFACGRSEVSAVGERAPSRPPRFLPPPAPHPAMQISEIRVDGFEKVVRCQDSATGLHA